MNAIIKVIKLKLCDFRRRKAGNCSRLQFYIKLFRPPLHYDGRRAHVLHSSRHKGLLDGEIVTS